MKGKNNKKHTVSNLIAMIFVAIVFVICGVTIQSFAWFRDSDEEVNSYQIGKIEIDENFSSQTIATIPVTLARQQLLNNDIVFTPSQDTSPLFVRFNVSYRNNLGTTTIAKEIMKYYNFSTYHTNEPGEANYLCSWVRFGDFYYFCNSSGVPIALDRDDYKENLEDCYIFLKKDSVVVSPRLSASKFSENEELFIDITLETIQARNVNFAELDEFGNIIPGEDGVVDSISDISQSFSTQYPNSLYTVTYKDHDNNTTNTFSDITYGSAATFLSSPATTPLNMSFVEWNTRADGSGAKITQEHLQNITEDLTIYPVFEMMQVSVFVSFGANGEITPNNGNNANVILDYNASSTFTVVPQLGYYISSVLIDGEPISLSVVHPGENYTHTFSNLTQNSSISATFAIRQYTLSFTTIILGDSETENIVTTSSELVDYGTPLYSLNITPPSGYYISSISIDGLAFVGFSSAGDTYIFENIDASHNLTAHFSRTVYNINYLKDGGIEEVGKENPTSFYVTTPSFEYNPVLKNGFIFVGWYDNPSFTGNPVTTFNKGSLSNISLYAKFIVRPESNTTSKYGYQCFPNFTYSTKHNVTFEDVESNDGLITKLTLIGNDPYFVPVMPSGFNATGNISQVRVLLDKNSAPINQFEVWTKNSSNASEIFRSPIEVNDGKNTWTTIDIPQVNTLEQFKPSDASSGYFLIRSIELVTELARANNGNVSLIAQTTSNLPENLTYNFVWRNTLSTLSSTSNAENFFTVNESDTYYCDISITDANNNNVISPYTLTYLVNISRQLSNTMSDVTGVYNSQPYSASVGTLPYGASVTYSYTGTLANNTNVFGTGNSVTEAGTYVVTAHIDGGLLWDDLTLSASITITKADLNLGVSSCKVLPGDEFINAITSPTSPVVSGLTYSSSKESVVVEQSSGLVSISTTNNIDRSLSVITINGGNNFHSTSYTISQEPYQFSDVSTLSKYLGSDSVVTIPATVSLLNTISNGVVIDETDARNYSVATIETNAFSELTNIVELILPTSLTTINANAITTLNSIQRIILTNTTDLSSSYTLSVVRDGTWFKNGVETTVLLQKGTYNNTGVIEGTSQDWEYSLQSDGIWAITNYLGTASTIKIPHKIYNVETETYDYVTGIKSIKESNKTLIRTAVISENITKIYDNAFKQYTSLTSVSLPSTMEHIGNMAFYQCYGLTSSINVSTCTSLEFIGDEAFRYCGYGLRSAIDLSLCDNLTELGDYCFGDAQSLTSFTIPNSIITMGHNIFINCSKLEAISVESGESLFLSDANVLYNSTKTHLYSYALGKTITNYPIPSSVTWISNYAFRSETNLLNIVFSGSDVTTVGDGAFANCSSLMRIDVPSGDLVSYKTLLSGSNETNSKGFNNDARMWGLSNENPTYGYFQSTYQWLNLETIVVTQSVGGIISPAGTIYVTPGVSYSFTISPNQGYYVSAITTQSGNQEITSDNSQPQTYTFDNIVSDSSYTLTATFTEKVVEIIYDGTVSYYSNVFDAFEFSKGKSGIEMTILKDTTYTANDDTSITADNLILTANTSIDLYSDYTLTFSGAACVYLNRNSTLNIRSGTIQAGNDDAIQNFGTLNIYGGTFCGGVASGYTVRTYGTTRMYGGSIFAGISATPVGQHSNSFFYMYGGTIDGRTLGQSINNLEGTRVSFVTYGSTLVMTGGNITGSQAAYTLIIQNSSVTTTATISGGTITAGSVGYAIRYASGTLKLSGNPSITSVNIASANLIIEQPSSLTIDSPIKLYVSQPSNSRVLVTSSQSSILDASKYELTNSEYSLHKIENNITMFSIRTITVFTKGSATNSSTTDTFGGTVKAAPALTAGTISSVALQYGESTTISEAVSSGYRFVGWYNSSSFLATDTPNSTATTQTVTWETADTVSTYYAYFRKTQTVTVAINKNINSGTSVSVSLNYWDYQGEKTAALDSTLSYLVDYSTSSSTLLATPNYSSNIFNLSWTANSIPEQSASGTAVSKTTDSLTQNRSYTIRLAQLFNVVFSNTLNCTDAPTLSHQVSTGPAASSSTSILAVRNTSAVTCTTSIGTTSNNYVTLMGTSSALSTAMSALLNSSSTLNVNSIKRHTGSVNLANLTSDTTVYSFTSQLFSITYNLNLANKSSTSSLSIKYTYPSNDTYFANKSVTVSNVTSSQTCYVFNSTKTITTSACPIFNTGMFNVTAANSNTIPTATTTSIASETFVSVATNGAMTADKNVSFRLNELSTINLDANGGTDGTTTSAVARFGYGMPNLSLPTFAGRSLTGVFDAASGGNQYYSLSGSSLSSSRTWNKGGTPHTLYAQWEYNTYNLYRNGAGTNLLTNSSFSDYTVATSPGWDNSLNGINGGTSAYNISGWGMGYNSGVPTPTTGYHAHGKYFGESMVIEYNNVNGRWLGISQEVAVSKLAVGNTYSITLNVYRASGTSLVSAGLHYAVEGTTTRAFNGSLFVFPSTATGVWQTITKTFTISSLNTSVSARFYVYGYSGDAGVCYVDNVRLERIITTSKVYNSSYTAAETTIPTDTGYTSTGWFSSTSYSTQVSSSKTFNSSTATFDNVSAPQTRATIFAKWNIDKLTAHAYARYYQAKNTLTTGNTGGTVKILLLGNTDGSSGADVSASFDYKTTVQFIATPQTSYTFAGWFSDAACTTLVSSSATYNYSLVDNKSLYAYFKKDVTITLNNQSATVPGTTSIKLEVGKRFYRDGIATFSIDLPSKIGYTFNGYYTDQNGAGSKILTNTGAINSSATYMEPNVTGSTAATIYAYWTANSYIVTLNNTLAGTTQSHNVNYNSTYGALSTLPQLSATGYDFLGWAKVLFNFKESGLVTENAEVNSSTGEFINGSTNYSTHYKLIKCVNTSGSNVNLYTNYTICGIYAYDINGNFIQRCSSYTKTHPIPTGTYYIRVESNKSYCSYNNFVNDLYVSRFELPAYSQSAAYILSNTTYTDACNSNLYSLWKPKEYTVTLKLITNTSSIVGTVQAYYDLPMVKTTAPTRTNCQFQGYFNDIRGAGTKYYNSNMTSARIYNIAASSTLYAYWYQRVECQLREINTGGSLTSSISSGSQVNGSTATSYAYIPYGGNYSNYFECTPAAGMTYGGFYSNSNCSTTSYVTRLEGDNPTTIYVKFNRNQYSVSYSKTGDWSKASLDAAPAGTYYYGAEPYFQVTIHGYAFAGNVCAWSISGTTSSWCSYTSGNVNNLNVTDTGGSYWTRGTVAYNGTVGIITTVYSNLTIAINCYKA